MTVIHPFNLLSSFFDWEGKRLIENGRFIVYGNSIEKSQSKAAIKWQNFFIKQFEYDPNEKYHYHARV
jgi:hypothetical protein